MKIFRIALLVNLAIIVCSCNKSRVIEEIKDLNGRIIQFPEYEVLACDSASIHDYDFRLDGIKLVSYLDKVPCSPCIISMLQDWAEEVKEELGVGFSYIIVLQADDRQELLNAIRVCQFRTPIIYYANSTFTDINKLHVLARNKTFLLSSDNKITVVGEPFGNKKLWNVYKRAINQLEHERAPKR